MFTEEYMH
jgi:hypothetical protein